MPLTPTGFTRAAIFPIPRRACDLFERYAPELAQAAVDGLQLGNERARVTHLLITCCTGFSAPGLDLEVIERCKLPGSVERTMIGFMGCYAAINALKLARHIVRSEQTARVLVVNLELCTLHLKETADIEQILSFLLFGDGCAACLVSADPVGTALDSFRAVVVPGTRDLMTWNIRDFGFDMILSGKVPAAIHEALHEHMGEILEGAPVELDRSLGGAPRRPHGARRRGARVKSGAAGARRIARGFASLREHVVGNRDVRDRTPATVRRPWTEGLRNVLWAGADR